MTEKDGLPDIEFYDIIEDSEGFIWLAADKGLFRYNGKEYKSYSHPKKRGLSVFNLMLDRKGRVWCNNVSGQFFYIEKDSLKLFADVNDKVKTTKLPVFSLDDNDNIYIATDSGLSFVDGETGKVELLLDKNNGMDDFHEIKYYQNKVYFLLDSLYIFKNKKLINQSSIDHTFWYKRTFEFNNRIYYVGSIAKRNTLNTNNLTTFGIIDISSGKITPTKIPKELKNKTIIQINEIEDRIWVSTNLGVYVYRIENDEFFFENNFFIKDFTSKTIKDLNGNYWVTTIKNGAHIIPNFYVSKLHIQEQHKNVLAIEVINDKLFYAIEDGKVGIKDLETGKEKELNFSKGFKANDFAYNQKTNSLFVSGAPRSLLWDMNSGKVFKIRSAGSKDLNTANDNSIVVSYHSGVDLFDFSNYKIEGNREKSVESFQRLNKFIRPKKLTTLSNVRSYTNFIKEDSTIYVGQVDKLYHIDENLSKTEIKHKGNSIFATDITETKDGTIWVATNDKGILGIKGKKILYNYNIEYGLISNQSLKIEADGNDLWVVTNKGLHFFERESESFKSFSFQNEIPIQKVNDIKLHKNKLYLSGNSGIFVVDKEHFQQKTKAPKVYFESIRIGGQEEERKEEYTIPHNMNSFEVEFNSNSFNSIESITYLYRLKGIEKDWKRTKTGVVRYPSLPTGSFTFQVKSITNKGIESKEIQLINLIVTKPFWNRWWFYAIIIILGFVYFKITLKKAQRKQQKTIENERISKELVFSQLENLRSQMNPHFIFNVLNSIQEYIITNDKYTASLYLADFSKLIRMYLDHSRKEKIRLSEEIKALKIYLDLEKNRFEEDFKYTISIDENVNLEKTYIPSLFIQPYIENSIKHGLLHKNNHKVLLVDFKYDDFDNTLVCNIVDNGIGREKSKKINEKREGYHVPFATKANSNRVLLLNKNRERKIIVKIVDLYTDQMKSKGTKITIQIPQ